MTRIDKIVKIKAAKISNKIDLHACSNEEINALMEVVKDQEKGLPRSVKQYQLIQNLTEKQSAEKGKKIGQFS